MSPALSINFRRPWPGPIRGQSVPGSKWSSAVDLMVPWRLLIAAGGWMLGVGALLAITTIAHLTSSLWLLRLTFGVTPRAGRCPVDLRPRGSQARRP
jgi:hypothetical protein